MATDSFGLDALADRLANYARELATVICDPRHPCRGTLEPIRSLSDPSVGVADADQDALLLTFAMLIARSQINRETKGGSDLLNLAQSTGLNSLDRFLYKLGTSSASSGKAANVIRSLWNELTEIDVIGTLNQLDSRLDTSDHLAYFFETLTARFNGTERRSRGIYFTPKPLVQYIVRSADAILRDDLHFADGLATSVAPLSILDPACGSGAFLLSVLQHLSQSSTTCETAHSRSVTRKPATLSTLVGIDVMPACCGAVSLILEAFSSSKRTQNPTLPHVPIYWANALDAVDLTESLVQDRIPIILGNPPYSNFGRQNQGDWILEQLRCYKSGLDERKINLNDDFIKFLRWGQYWIDQAGCGVMAMVINNTYAGGVTHRQMRMSLARSFDKIYVLDLLGGRNKQHRKTELEADENVFAIQQGVSIGLFVKKPRKPTRDRTVAAAAAHVEYAQLRGSRESKFRTLDATDIRSTPWTSVPASPPNFFFIPGRDPGNSPYLDWPRLDNIFQHYISGVQTKRDSLFVGFTHDAVRRKIGRFLEQAAKGHFESDIPDWLRLKAERVPFDPGCIQPYMVAPFDIRWVYYEPRLLGRARHQVLKHLHSGNTALLFMRQTTNPGCYDHFLATSFLASDRVFFSAHGAPFVAPLWLDIDNGSNGQRSNLTHDFLDTLSRRIGVPITHAPGSSSCQETGKRSEIGAISQTDSPTSERNLTQVTGASRRQQETILGPQDVFHWLYAVVFCPSYRQQYDALLKIDFPRIPWPVGADQFRRMAELGKQLIDTHLQLQRSATRQQPQQQDDHIAKPIPSGYPRWTGPNNLVLSPDPLLSCRMDQSVWQFRLGGYQVVSHWIKQRRQQGLDRRDMAHVQRLDRAIRKTIDLMDQIDRDTTNIS